ncbi:hypothetical protein SESBI_41119 [Sesbania bispinosa]|nr:hypothetical protein SESBI_41119 [Sesbania bispinosa]
MASVQCQEKTQHSSFGQKVSDLFKGHHHSASSCTQTKVHSQARHSHTTIKTSQTDQCYQANKSHRIRGHKKNLIQRVKDGLSGHSSDSGTSSESESESDSDDEKCQNRRKN